MIEIPVADTADQELSVIMEGRRVTMRLRYNPTSERWSMDLSVDDQPVIFGRRIVLWRDLLEGLQLNLGVLFAAGNVAPDRQALPSGLVRLYHASVSDVAALPS